MGCRCSHGTCHRARADPSSSISTAMAVISGIAPGVCAALLARDGIMPNRLVLYGESLGSGVAVYLASQREIGALILEASFTSVAEIAQYHYSFVPASLLLWDRFDSFSRIGNVKAPILLLHGDRDRVVPVRFGRALFEAAPEPKKFWFSPEAGHEDLARFGALDAVAAFLERHLG